VAKIDRNLCGLVFLTVVLFAGVVVGKAMGETGDNENIAELQSAGSNFDVKWTLVRDGIIHRVYEVEVINKDLPCSVDLQAVIDNTNLDISELRNFRVEMLMNLPYLIQTPVYENVQYQEYNENTKEWENRWRMELVGYDNKLGWREEWIELIPEWFSKTERYTLSLTNFSVSNDVMNRIKEPKQMFSELETFELPSKMVLPTGTLKFRVSFDTSISLTQNGWGSSGKVAFWIDGVEHHPWWDSNWTRRKQITISGDHPDNCQIAMHVVHDSDMNTDFSDLRFLENEDAGELDYWIENLSPSNYADVWVRRLDNGGVDGLDTTIWMYYGNAAASPVSNENDTFYLADNFNAGSLDTNKWVQETNGGGTSFSATTVTLIADASGEWTTLRSVVDIPSPAWIEAQIAAESGRPGVGFGNDTTTSSHGWLYSGYLYYGFWYADADTYLHSIDSSGTEGQVGHNTNTPKTFFRFTWHDTTQRGTDNEGASEITANDTTVAIGSTYYPYINTTYGSGAGNAEFDWVRVRTFFSTPPTVTFGAEETSNAPPNTPENLAPSTRQTTTDVTLSADVWDNDGDDINAFFYDNSDNSLIDNVWVSGPGGTAQVTWSGLTRGQTYAFYVRAEDNNGASSDNSAVQSFLVNSLPTAAAVSPENNGENENLNPVLDWSFSDADGDSQTKYWVVVDNDPDFSSPTENTGEVTSDNTFHAVENTLDWFTVYYWKLKVHDGYEWSEWQGVWNFRTANNIHVENMLTYNSDMEQTSNFAVGENVITRFEVKDNLGAAHIEGVYLTITDPTGEKRVNHEGILSFQDTFENENAWNDLTADHWNIDDGSGADPPLPAGSYYQMGQNEGSSTYKDITLVKESYQENLTEVTITCDVYIDFSNEDSERLIFRYLDNNNYIAGFISETYSAVGIEEYIDGERYYTDTSMLLSENTWYEVKVTTDGDSATIYVNGDPKVTRTGLTVRSGRVGLGADTGWIYFDNYIIGNPNGEKIADVENGYRYQYTYTLPDNLDLAGDWTITAEAVAVNEASETVTITVAADFPVIKNAAVYDENLAARTDFRDGENVVVRADMLDAQNPDLFQHQIWIYNPQGTAKVENAAMENVGAVSHGATYEYSYVIPQEAASDGTWTVSLYAEDNDGNGTWDNSLSFEVDIKDPEFEVLLTYTTENAEKAEYAFGETVRIRAEISDPDGRDNISGVTVTLKNQSGETVVSGVAMTDVGDIDNGNIYSYDYVLPSSEENRGVWEATVSATDGIYTTTSRITFVLDWYDNDFDYRRPITLVERFGVDRTNEELGFVFEVDASKLADGSDARIVTDRGVELPFRIWKETTSGTALTVYYNFLENISADNTETVYIYYDNDTAPVSYPDYASDMNRTLVETVYELWYNENAGDNITYGKAIKVYDVDGDGENEIIVVGRTHAGTGYNRGFIRIYGVSFTTPASAALTLEDNITWLTDNHTFVYSLDIADLDDDGSIELVTGGVAYDGTRNRAELNVWSYSGGFTNEDNLTWYYDNTAIYGVLVDDVDCDGDNEILVAGTCNNSENGVFRIYSFAGGSLTLETAADDVYLSAGKLCELYGIATGDFYGDGGTKEIAVVGEAKDTNDVINAFFKIYRWDNATLSDDWTKNWYDGNLSELFSVAMGHADNDENVELVVGGNYFDGTRDIAMFKVWNATGAGYPNTLVEEGSVEWYISGHSSALTAMIEDVDRDSIPEITTVGFQNDGTLDRGDTKIRLWKGSSEENEYSEIWEQPTSVRSGDFYDAAAVSDLNADGINELIYTGRYGMTPPTGTFVRVMGVTGVTLTLGSEELKEVPNIAPEIVDVSVDSTLVDRKVDNAFSGADNDVKITIRVRDNDNWGDISEVRLWIRDNQDVVVVDNVLVADNSVVDENTLDLTYWYDPDDALDHLGMFDVSALVCDIPGASDNSGWDDYFVVDDDNVTAELIISGDNLRVVGRVSRLSGLPVSLDNAWLVDNVAGTVDATDNYPVADNFEGSYSPGENGQVYAVASTNGALDGVSAALTYEVVYLLIENRSLSGTQDDATLWVEVGYSDSAALENVSAQLWVDSGTDNMVLSRVTPDENRLIFSSFDPPDNVENLTFRLENMLDNRSDKVVSFLHAEDNALFVENTTIGVSVNGTAGEIFAGQTAVFSGTLTSRSGWLTMVVDAMLKSYDVEIDSETHSIAPGSSADWALSDAPISSTWYTIEMYGSPTLLWSTDAYVEVYNPPTGTGTPPPSGFEAMSKYLLVVVVLDENGEPLENATVDVGIETKQTDESGTAVFKLPAGGYTVTVSKEGYEEFFAGISDIRQISGLNVTLEALEEEEKVTGIPAWLLIGLIGLAGVIFVLFKR